MRFRRATPAARAPLALILPMVALQLLAVGTLVLGRDTLYLRDVLTTHLPMKQAEAQALRRGELPELDVQRGGGQPLLGNPNGAPFYPDTLLCLVAPTRWAVNAHFWLHFLLAPWTFAWLARRLGCDPDAAWAGGAAYTLSGFLLSQLSYYDLVAGATLAPALVAACLLARDGALAVARRRGAAAAGAVWAMLLLGGDPAFAALAMVAALLALVLAPRPLAGETAGAGAPPGLPGALDGWPSTGVEGTVAIAAATAGASQGRLPLRRTAARWLPLALAIAAGTALAAPQLSELLRILSASTRGVRGYDAAARTLGSWDPRQALEQLLPLAFGRLDRTAAGGFWGYRFHTGALPFFLTLYPGLLPLGLAVAAGRRRGAAVGWVLVGCGVLLALGRFDPLVAALAALPGGGLLRFPVKAWLLVAIGLSVLAATGWQRAVSAGEPRARRCLRATLLVLAAVLALGALAALAARPALRGWMVRQLPGNAPPQLVAGEATRWGTLAAGLAVLAVVLAALLWRPSRHLAATALALQAAAQLALLAPATLARDSVAPYARAPAFADLLPTGTRLAHGSLGRLFGPVRRRPPPDGDGRWLARQGAAAGLPLVGVQAGWRYELATSPEGLDGFLTRLGADAVRSLDDARRVRLLRVWGVQALLLERPLAVPVAGASLVARAPGPLATTYLYRLAAMTPEVRWVAGARYAADPRSALVALLDPELDPSREVVLPGTGEPVAPGGGRVQSERATAERTVMVTHEGRAGWVVVQRAWQPLWRATVDGHPAAVVPADLHRLAVAVPAGSHHLRLWVDRQPLHRATALAVLGAALLLALAAWKRRSAAGATTS